MVGNETTTIARELEDIAALEAPGFADGRKPLIESSLEDKQKAYERIWEQYFLDQREKEEREMQQRAIEEANLNSNAGLIRQSLEAAVGQEVKEVSRTFGEKIYKADGRVVYRSGDKETILEKDDTLFKPLLDSGHAVYREHLSGSCIVSDSINERGERVVTYALLRFAQDPAVSENFLPPEITTDEPVNNQEPPLPVHPSLEQTQPPLFSIEPKSLLEIFADLVPREEPLHEFQPAPEAPVTQEINTINAPDPFLVETPSAKQPVEFSPPLSADENITSDEAFTPIQAANVPAINHVTPRGCNMANESGWDIAENHQSEAIGPINAPDPFFPDMPQHPTKLDTTQANEEPRARVEAAAELIEPEINRVEKVIQKPPLHETPLAEQIERMPIEQIFSTPEANLSVCETTPTVPAIEKTNSYTTLESPYLTTSAETIITAVETHLQPVATIQLEAGSPNSAEPFLAMVEPVLQREITAAISSVQASAEPHKIVISPRPGERALDSALIVSGTSEKVTLELFAAAATPGPTITETAVQTETTAPVIINEAPAEHARVVEVSLRQAQIETGGISFPHEEAGKKRETEKSTAIEISTIPNDQPAEEVQSSRRNPRTQVPFLTFPGNLGPRSTQLNRVQQTTQAA